MPGTHPPNILVGGTSTGISPPILLYTFGYSRPILVALRSLSLKPFSFGYKTPPIRFSQAGGQSAHEARPPNLGTRVDATVEEAEVDMSILVFMASVGSSFLICSFSMLLLYRERIVVVELQVCTGQPDRQTVCVERHVGVQGHQLQYAAAVPASPNPAPTTQPQPATDHYDAVSTFHNDDFCAARLPMLCSGCLELITENCR